MICWVRISRFAASMADEMTKSVSVRPRSAAARLNSSFCSRETLASSRSCRELESIMRSIVRQDAVQSSAHAKQREAAAARDLVVTLGLDRRYLGLKGRHVIAGPLIIQHHPLGVLHALEVIDVSPLG